MKVTNGNIIILGPHRLFCGSCTNSDNIKRLVGANKINVIASDVPYGIAAVESKKYLKSKSSNRAIKNDQLQSDNQYQRFMQGWLSAIKPYLNIPNTCYIFNADKMVFSLKEALDAEGFYFSQLLVWVKNHTIIGRLDYLPQHELIVYCWYGKHKFRKSKDKSVFFYPKTNKSKIHPTIKPVGLMRNLILNSTEIGDIVYDGFLGSGTTLLACEQTKRKCYGCEIDLEYCETIIDRYEKLSGQLARKENTNE